MDQQWQARFDAFVAAKTAAAASASLPPYVTDESEPGGRLIPIGNDWSVRLFDGPFYVSPPHPDRPACSLVFVQSADGNTGTNNPSSLGGGETDKHLIYEGLSRVTADAVLAGAETVRGGNILFSVFHPALIALRDSHGLPRHPVQIVATLRGVDLNAGLLFNVPEVPVVLLTVDDAAARMKEAITVRPWITALTMNRADGLPRAFWQLRATGIESISCIGGRHLARQLLDAGLVDDVYLTTAPSAGGEPNTPLHTGPWRGTVVTRKHGTGLDNGVIFEHIRPQRVDHPKWGHNERHA